ncbi:MAG TPA: tRNA preQ1(34) S-adenosylmethionine ribosyltransferase-isomerase QueA [Acidimicrobiales bacterium]|nr:tRNA preQ1(34) S-adenosylmethionine ribosyltransferase-isomerase QueA [Acidimicrobiales bacterium]
MQLAEFDYALPEEAIAQHPVEPRDAARLLVDGGTGAAPSHRTVADLPELVRPGDVIVVNTTRVLPARLLLRKATGGAAEVLLLERAGEATWEALVRPGRRLPPGTLLTPADGPVARAGGPPDDDGAGKFAVEVGEVVGDDGRRLVHLHLDGAEDELAALERHGAVPLPPYITAPLADAERYQTVYADRPGSVAAPTAGLHLTEAVLDGCRAVGADVVPVELLVGLGTFRPIATERVEDHVMHAERYVVPEATQAAVDGARRVVAVGTTAVRALESAAATGRPTGRTDLFIRRPYPWRVVDVLLTNFHMPRSSLLVLIDAFVGPRWRDLYATALDGGYRFLSFGDAMLLTRTEGR